MKISGERHYLWRSVDHEGEVLECDVAKKWDKRAALRTLKKALKRHGKAKNIVTDGLKSYRNGDASSRKFGLPNNGPMVQ